jgi:hypothetical protein
MTPRWVRGGPSPNPGGRPKSATLVARAVAEKTDGGREIVDRVLAIARGEDATISSERSRTWALEWLADRVWGKPISSIELVGNAPQVPPRIDANLSDEEMREIIRCCDRVAELQAKAVRRAPLAQLQEIAAGESPESAAQIRARGMSSAELRRVAAGLPPTDDTDDTDGDLR